MTGCEGCIHAEGTDVLRDVCLIMGLCDLTEVEKARVGRRLVCKELLSMEQVRGFGDVVGSWCEL